MKKRCVVGLRMVRELCEFGFVFVDMWVSEGVFMCVDLW